MKTQFQRMHGLAFGWSIFAVVLFSAASFVFGYVCSDTRKLMMREALVRVCESKDKLASTIYVGNRDIQVCSDESHVMERIQ